MHSFSTTLPQHTQKFHQGYNEFKRIFNFFFFFRVRGLVRRRRPVSSLAIWIPIGTNLSFFSLMKWIWREFGLMLQWVFFFFSNHNQVSHGEGFFFTYDWAMWIKNMGIFLAQKPATYSITIRTKCLRFSRNAFFTMSLFDTQLNPKSAWS